MTREIDTGKCMAAEEDQSEPIAEVDTTPPKMRLELDALKAEIERLKAEKGRISEDEKDLEALQSAAEAASMAERAPDEDSLAAKVFRGGERSLQALNPEISVVGDVFGQFIFQSDEVYSPSGRSGFVPRILGIHLQSNLDPFSFTKMCIGITPEGAEFGEGYITWTNVTSWLSLTLGKFRQQFGIVNRWHKPGLDQLDFPLMLREHFGPGGLNQVGLSALFFLPPVWSDALELELQITNGMNPKMFSGEFFSIPSGLLHMRNYWDINRDTYLELGLTGLFGTNAATGRPTMRDPEPVQLYDANGEPVTFYDADGNPVAVVSAPGATAVVNDSKHRLTAVGGADLTLNWEPLNQAKYQGFTWRTEFLYAYKEVTGVNGGDATILSWGLYSYAQYKFMRNWIFGARFDLTQPFVRNSERQELRTELTWAVVPYLTWWQSPWVRLRAQYSYTDWATSQPEHRVVFQVTFAAGPHKHERY